MTCVEEVATLKSEVGPAVGGEEHLSFDVLNGKMTVTPGPAPVSSELVVAAVARTGMRADPWQDGTETADRPGWRHGRVLLTVVSGSSALAGLLLHAWQAGGLRAALGSQGMGLA
jgi:Cd2+/Zn2+-exporting ATPase